MKKLAYLTSGLGERASTALPTRLTHEDIDTLGLNGAFKHAGAGFCMLVARAASLSKYAKYHGTTWREIRADGGIVLELVDIAPMEEGSSLDQAQERLQPHDEECVEKRVHEHAERERALREQVDELHCQLDEIDKLLADPNAANAISPVRTNPMVTDQTNYINGPQMSMASKIAATGIDDVTYLMQMMDNLLRSMDTPEYRRWETDRMNRQIAIEMEEGKKILERLQAQIIDANDLREAIKEELAEETDKQALLKLRQEYNAAGQKLQGLQAQVYDTIKDYGLKQGSWGRGKPLKQKGYDLEEDEAQEEIDEELVERKKKQAIEGQPARMIWQVSAEFPDAVCKVCAAKQGMEVHAGDLIPPLHKECKCKVVNAADPYANPTLSKRKAMKIAAVDYESFFGNPDSKQAAALLEVDGQTKSKVGDTDWDGSPEGDEWLNASQNLRDIQSVLANSWPPELIKAFIDFTNVNAQNGGGRALEDAVSLLNGRGDSFMVTDMLPEKTSMKTAHRKLAAQHQLAAGDVVNMKDPSLRPDLTSQVKDWTGTVAASVNPDSTWIPIEWNDPLLAQFGPKTPNVGALKKASMKTAAPTQSALTIQGKIVKGGEGFSFLAEDGSSWAIDISRIADINKDVGFKTPQNKRLSEQLLRDPAAVVYSNNEQHATVQNTRANAIGDIVDVKAFRVHFTSEPTQAKRTPMKTAADSFTLLNLPAAKREGEKAVKGKTSSMKTAGQYPYPGAKVGDRVVHKEGLNPAGPGTIVDIRPSEYHSQMEVVMVEHDDPTAGTLPWTVEDGPLEKEPMKTAADSFTLLNLPAAKREGEERDKKDYNEDLKEIGNLYGGEQRDTKTPQELVISSKDIDEKKEEDEEGTVTQYSEAAYLPGVSPVDSPERPPSRNRKKQPPKDEEIELKDEDLELVARKQKGTTGMRDKLADILDTHWNVETHDPGDAHSSPDIDGDRSDEKRDQPGPHGKQAAIEPQLLQQFLTALQQVPDDESDPDAMAEAYSAACDLWMDNPAYEELTASNPKLADLIALEPSDINGARLAKAIALTSQMMSAAPTQASKSSKIAFVLIAKDDEDDKDDKKSDKEDEDAKDDKKEKSDKKDKKEKKESAKKDDDDKKSDKDDDEDDKDEDEDKDDKKEKSDKKDKKDKKSDKDDDKKEASWPGDLTPPSWVNPKLSSLWRAAVEQFVEVEGGDPDSEQAYAQVVSIYKTVAKKHGPRIAALMGSGSEDRNMGGAAAASIKTASRTHTDLALFAKHVLGMDDEGDAEVADALDSAEGDDLGETNETAEPTLEDIDGKLDDILDFVTEMAPIEVDEPADAFPA